MIKPRGAFKAGDGLTLPGFKPLAPAGRFTRECNENPLANPGLIVGELELLFARMIC